MSSHSHVTPRPGNCLEDLDPRVRPLYDGTFFPKPTAEMELADPTVDKLCIMCDKPGNKLCNGNCRTRYCSKTCEEEDKHIHKHICSHLPKAHQLRAEKAEPADYAIMFSFDPTAKAAIPTFVNKSDLLEAYKKMRKDYQNLDPTYEEEEPAAFEIIVNSCVPWRRVGHGLKYWGSMVRAFDDDPTIRKLGPNAAIMRLSPAGTAYQIHESVKIFAYTRVQAEDGKSSHVQIEDVTARDFRTAVDFFQTMRANTVSLSSSTVSPRYKPCTDYVCALKCIPDPRRFKLPAQFYGCQLWHGIKLNSQREGELYAHHQPDGKYALREVQPIVLPSIALNGLPRKRVPWANLIGLSWYVQEPFGIQAASAGTMEKKMVMVNHMARWFCTESIIIPELRFGDELASVPLFDDFNGTVVVTHETGAEIHPLHVVWMVELLDEAAENKLELPFGSWFMSLWKTGVAEREYKRSQQAKTEHSVEVKEDQKSRSKKGTKDNSIASAMAEMSIQDKQSKVQGSATPEFTRKKDAASAQGPPQNAKEVIKPSKKGTNGKPSQAGGLDSSEPKANVILPRPTLRNDFRARWAKWIKDQAKAHGEDYSDIPCPYDNEPE